MIISRIGIALAIFTVGALTLGPWLQGESEQYGVPRWFVVQIMFQMGPRGIWCEAVGCEPEIAEGLHLERFSEEPIEGAIVALAVDVDGRVYTAETHRLFEGAQDNRYTDLPDGWLLDDLASRSVEDRLAYYTKYAENGEGKPLTWYTGRSDFLRVYEDTTGDGVADSIRTLLELNDAVTGLASGIWLERDFMLFADIPTLWRLDRPPEERAGGERSSGPSKEMEATALFTGFGVKTSLPGHDLHGFARGPDGKLYFSMGDRGYLLTTLEGRRLEPDIAPGRGAIFRMNLDGTELEVFATGVRNPQELAFDDYGNLFTGDNNGDGGDSGRIVYLVEGGETGWLMPYQSLEEEDYLLGPWLAEGLWELQHPDQPAWVIPPLAHLSVGPAGFAAYPGLGLPERYDQQFFLCDYRYTQYATRIWSFGLEASGAGFAVKDEAVFLRSVLVTDLDFTVDGRMIVSEFRQLAGETSSLYVVEHPEARSDPRIVEAAAFLRKEPDTFSTLELIESLDFVDRRVRLAAQFELARRGAVEPFSRLSLDVAAPVRARLHAVWGLGQLGHDAIAEAGWGNFDWLTRQDDELVAQVVKVLGESEVESSAHWVADQLRHSSARVRFFAALSVGKLQHRRALPGLVELLRENDDRDVFLRHAGVMGLAGLDALDSVVALAADPSPAVRMGALLVLRRAKDERVATFLLDSEARIVVEAARAIYDLPIAAAMESLAQLESTAPGAQALSGDSRVQRALHRRVIAANVVLGTEAAAERIGAHAANPDHPLEMRELALAALESFPSPGPREPVYGIYRPLAARDPGVVYAALDRLVPKLVGGPLEARGLEVAVAHDRVSLPAGDLLSRVGDADRSSAIRIASLQALNARAKTDANARGALGRAVEAALGSDDAMLRAEARDLWVEIDPVEAYGPLAELPADAALMERQRALQALAGLDDPRVATLALGLLSELEAGGLQAGLGLEVLELARSRDEPEVLASVARYEATLEESSDPLARYRFALAGGSVDRGRRVFVGAGSCKRCHSGGGHAAQAGPELAGLSERRDPEFMLRAVIDPNSEIAEGFGSVSITRSDDSVVSGRPLEETESELVLETASGPVTLDLTDIVDRTVAASGMPPQGLALDPRQLRDLIAYLGTL